MVGNGLLSIALITKHSATNMSQIMKPEVLPFSYQLCTELIQHTVDDRMDKPSCTG